MREVIEPVFALDCPSRPGERAGTHPIIRRTDDNGLIGQTLRLGGRRTEELRFDGALRQYGHGGLVVAQDRADHAVPEARHGVPEAGWKVFVGMPSVGQRLGVDTWAEQRSHRLEMQ